MNDKRTQAHISAEAVPAFDFLDRFADRIMPEPNSGCWLWVGAQTTAGYGCFTHKRKVYYAHRSSYEASHGGGSAGRLYVRHRCDTPACVNPDHLEIGTALDNSNDKYSRGRGNIGERGGNARLTEAQVLEILDMRKAGSTYAEIARCYGIDGAMASLICRGLRWHRITKINERRAALGCPELHGRSPWAATRATGIYLTGGNDE